MTAIRNGHDAAEHDTGLRRINGARAALEGEIRDLVRRNVAPLKRSEGEPVMPLRRAESEPANDAAGHQVNDLIRRVSGSSMEEIDRVIRELNGVRELLRSEGERVTRDIAGFASLSHAAVTSMRVIADSLAEWKNGAQIRPDAR